MSVATAELVINDQPLVSEDLLQSLGKRIMASEVLEVSTEPIVVLELGDEEHGQTSQSQQSQQSNQSYQSQQSQQSQQSYSSMNSQQSTHCSHACHTR